MIKIVKYLLLVVVVVSIIINYIQYKKEPVVRDIVTYRDTTIVVMKDTTIYKFIEELQYVYVDSTDTSTIKKQNDLIDSLVDALDENRYLVVSDTTKFYTGDSLITDVALFYPIGFTYFFFPHPDTIIKDSTVVTITKPYHPWATLRANGVLPLYHSPLYLSADLLFDVSQGYKFGLGYKYDIVENNFGGILILTKQWNIKNPLTYIFGR